MVLLEVEERLIKVLVDECEGMLWIGPNKGRLEGGSKGGSPGIQELVYKNRVAAAAAAAEADQEMKEAAGTTADLAK